MNTYLYDGLVRPKVYLPHDESSRVDDWGGRDERYAEGEHDGDEESEHDVLEEDALAGSRVSGAGHDIVLIVVQHVRVRTSNIPRAAIARP